MSVRYLLTGSTNGNLRAQLSGYYCGAFFSPVATETATAIGCRILNAIGLITVYLVAINSSTVLTQAAVNPANAGSNGFAYGAISPVDLTGGVSYGLIADTGQFSSWGDMAGSSYSYSSDFVPEGPMYTTAPAGGPYTVYSTPTQQYVGVDLRYGVPDKTGAAAVLLGV
jgi:hypothetical protein